MLETLAVRFGLPILFGKLKNIQIPRWVWMLIAGVVLIVGGLLWHNHSVSEFEKSIRDDQKIKDHAEFQGQLDQAHNDAEGWKNTYMASDINRTTQESNNHDTVVDANAALATTLRVHGAGQASPVNCGQVNNSATQSSSSGHETGSGTSNASMDPVSSGQRPDLILVPRDDLIALGQFHDNNRDEVKTWRQDKDQQEILYKTLLSDQLSGK